MKENNELEEICAFKIKAMRNPMGLSIEEENECRRCYGTARDCPMYIPYNPSSNLKTGSDYASSHYFNIHGDV